MTAYLKPFEYNASVIRVIDGDTIECDVMDDLIASCGEANR